MSATACRVLDRHAKAYVPAGSPLVGSNKPRRGRTRLALGASYAERTLPGIDGAAETGQGSGCQDGLRRGPFHRHREAQKQFCAPAHPARCSTAAAPCIHVQFDHNVTHPRLNCPPASGSCHRHADGTGQRFHTSVNRRRALPRHAVVPFLNAPLPRNGPSCPQIKRETTRDGSQPPRFRQFRFEGEKNSLISEI